MFIGWKDVNGRRILLNVDQVFLFEEEPPMKEESHVLVHTTESTVKRIKGSIDEILDLLRGQSEVFQVLSNEDEQAFLALAYRIDTLVPFPADHEISILEWARQEIAASHEKIERVLAQQKENPYEEVKHTMA